eukprot:1340939-Amphidinium_carterae.3
MPRRPNQLGHCFLRSCARTLCNGVLFVSVYPMLSKSLRTSQRSGSAVVPRARKPSVDCSSADKL